MAAAFASNGYTTYAQALVIGGGILAVVIRPSFDDPGTYWAIAVAGVMIVLGLAFTIIGGVIRIRRLNASVREDRRRLAAGLPLERDDLDVP
jgi:hypothetical protein